MSVIRQNVPRWLKGVIYQIYLRSFKDSNGDGVGDLRGIIESLDYLSWLGIGSIWVSPFHPSPLLDSGYDITDFTSVHSTFGTLADFDKLIEECHRREIRFIYDFVGNHTSDQHPWFVDSCSSRKSEYRDWYYWHEPGAQGAPPNNWLNEYGQSAWTWHAETEQFYLHSFLAQQPDLNWRNPEVRAAMHDVLRFWLDRGVDGIRIDALPWMMKDLHLRSNPPNPKFIKSDPARQVYPAFTQDLPCLTEVITGLRTVIDEYSERALLGEIRLAIERYPSYYDAGLHFPFNYQLTGKETSAFELRKIIDTTEGLLGEAYWPNWFLGTHDESRIITRYGIQAARVMSMLMLTLRGTAVIYYGQELGMADTKLPPAAIQDTYELLLPGLGRGRDPQRTPMQWNNTIHAGFSQHKPWLPVSKGYQQCNVAFETEHCGSDLHYHRNLIQLRGTSAFLDGMYIPGECNAQAFAFQRIHEQDSYQVCLNLSDQPLKLSLAAAHGIVVADTHGVEKSRVQNEIALRPWQGQVIRLD